MKPVSLGLVEGACHQIYLVCMILASQDGICQGPLKDQTLCSAFLFGCFMKQLIHLGIDIDTSAGSAKIPATTSMTLDFTRQALTTLGNTRSRNAFAAESARRANTWSSEHSSCGKKELDPLLNTKAEIDEKMSAMFEDDHLKQVRENATKLGWKPGQWEEMV